MSNIARTALRGVTYYDPLKADDGYTVFPIGDMGVVMIDMEGRIVHRWRTGRGVHTARLLSNGLLSCSQVRRLPSKEKGYLPDGEGYPPDRSDLHGAIDADIVEYDWDSNIVWKASVPYQTHDIFCFDEAPGDKWPKNGHYIFPTFHPVGVFPDELAEKWQGGVAGTEYEGKIWGDSIYEIDRDGKIVWEWFSRDHLDPVIDAFPPLDMRGNFHSNSVFLSREGNIILSARVLCELKRIEYPGGKVIARYGRGELYHQHNATELENGNILVFDNGSHRSNYYGPEYSRAVEIDPGTNKVVWEYKADPPFTFRSDVISGCKRLANGNTIICEGYTGRIFEVTCEGELVWEYVVPWWSFKYRGLTNMMYRAERYPKNHPAFKSKDLDPARYRWENRIWGPEAWKRGGFRPLIF